MATWGDFIAEVTVIRPGKTEGGKGNAMYVQVDQVIGIWEERNTLRGEVQRLQGELAGERAACAQEVDEFAQACEDEGTEQALTAAQVLRAAAELIRERSATPEEEQPADGPPSAPVAEEPEVVPE